MRQRRKAARERTLEEVALKEMNTLLQIRFDTNILPKFVFYLCDEYRQAVFIRGLHCLPSIRTSNTSLKRTRT